LLQIYREKAEQRRLATLPKSGEKGFQKTENIQVNVTQKIGEHCESEAVEQFAAAVHSNPEKAEQRQQATQLAGKDEQGNPVFSVTQNIGEPKGVTLLVGKGIQQQDLMVTQNLGEREKGGKFPQLTCLI